MIKIIKKLFCKHDFNEPFLVFASKPLTHHDIKTCRKCGKDVAVFKGTRIEWHEHHDFYLNVGLSK